MANTMITSDIIASEVTYKLFEALRPLRDAEGSLPSSMDAKPWTHRDDIEITHEQLMCTINELSETVLMPVVDKLANAVLSRPGGTFHTMTVPPAAYRSSHRVFRGLHVLVMPIFGVEPTNIARYTIAISYH